MGEETRDGGTDNAQGAGEIRDEQQLPRGAEAETRVSSKIERASDTIKRIAQEAKEPQDEDEDLADDENRTEGTQGRDDLEGTDSEDEDQTDDDHEVNAPSCLSPKEAEEWKDTPSAIKEAFLRREKSLTASAQRAHNKTHRITQEYEQKLQEIEGSRIEAKFQPYFDEARRKFGEEATADKVVERLLQFDMMASSSVGGAYTAVAQIAQNLGLKLDDFLNGMDAWIDSGTPRQYAPQVPRREVTKQRSESQERTISPEELANLEEQIYKFGDEKGDDGYLLRPFFRELEPQIVAYLEVLNTQYPNATMPQKLDAAYRKAAMDSPQAQAYFREIQEVKERREKEKRLKKARRQPQGVPISSNVQPRPVGKMESVQETIRRLAGSKAFEG